MNFYLDLTENICKLTDTFGLFLKNTRIKHLVMSEVNICVPVSKKIRIKGRKRSSGFLRIFTVAFLLF